MNYFEQLIYDMILCEATPPGGDAEPASDESASTASGNLGDYIVKNISDLVGPKYAPLYDGVPSADEVRAVITAWTPALTREGAAQFKELGYLLPVIYLVWKLVNAHGKPTINSFTSPWDQAKAAPIIANFQKRLTETKSRNPIDFKVVDDTKVANILRIIKTHVGSSVGQLALTKFDNESIRDALYHLLAARKAVRLKTLKVKTVPDAGPAVEKVLRNSKQFAGGQRLFDPKLSTVYTEPVEKDILSIAIAAEKFFNEQVTEYTPPVKEGEAQPVCNTDLWDFLTNSSVGADSMFSFVWTDDSSAKKEIKAETAGKGGYVIKNIRTLATSNKSPGATLLYRELEDFANYIRKQEPFDWVNALKNTAAGLKSVEGALGIKM